LEVGLLALPLGPFLLVEGPENADQVDLEDEDHDQILHDLLDLVVLFA
jgi:hypothetical protein